jgi:hypothetical protein
MVASIRSNLDYRLIVAGPRTVASRLILRGLIRLIGRVSDCIASDDPRLKKNPKPSKSLPHHPPALRVEGELAQFRRE